MTAERLQAIQGRLTRRHLDPVGWSQNAPSDMAYLLNLAVPGQAGSLEGMNDTNGMERPHGANVDVAALRQQVGGAPRSPKTLIKKGLPVDDGETETDDQEDGQ